MEQRSDAWFAARLGKATASRISDIMARTKTGYSASRANYMAQLVVERLTNRKEESYTNAAMQRGTETEPLARSAYEVAKDVLVQEVGFIDHPEIEMSGASPDGLVGDDGMVEIKCPSTATHIETLLNDTVDGKYQYQMLWQMRCAGRKWCDFVSFDPRMPEELQLKVIRFEYDQGTIDQIEDEVHKFLSEVNEKVWQLLRVKNGISQ
jgi:putative phage-type endonuclease